MADYLMVIHNCSDLPSHGRSSGLHTFLEDADHLPNSIHAVLKDVQRKDKSRGVDSKNRKLFIFGMSMGGFTVINYAARYQKGEKIDAPGNPRVDGVIAVSS